MTKGSHATFAGISPERRVCPECGRPVRITRESCWLQTFPEPWAWHAQCKLDRMRRERA